MEYLWPTKTNPKIGIKIRGGKLGFAYVEPSKMYTQNTAAVRHTFAKYGKSSMKLWSAEKP